MGESYQLARTIASRIMGSARSLEMLDHHDLVTMYHHKYLLETDEYLQEHVANHNKWDNPKSPSEDTNSIPWNAYVV